MNNVNRFNTEHFGQFMMTWLIHIQQWSTHINWLPFWPYRYSRSSPFRPLKATRMQMMHETILRDQMRVASIHGQINRMLNGVPTKTTNLNQQQKIIPAQDFQGPIVSGLSLGSGEYFVRISVGTPPKSMYLVVDTGSDILWLQCAQCINCYHQSDAIFNPANSSTYSVVGCGSPLCLNLDVSGCQSNKCLYQVSSPSLPS